MEWVIHLLRQHSELAIFLTIAAGFWIGKMKIKQFSLGIVTSVLLVGVLVGQLNITIEEPVKSVFFLLFLFAIGYKVGPQFFRGLKKDGLPQVGFAALMCIGCYVSYSICHGNDINHITFLGRGYVESVYGIFCYSYDGRDSLCSGQ